MLESAISRRQLIAFTALGDPTLLVISALAVLLYLWIRGDSHRLARSWMLLLVACVTVTVIAKIAFYLLEWRSLGFWRLHSPSGHVAIATAIYGGCATLLAAGRPYAKKLLVWSVTSALVIALALSRLMLELHSATELAAGLVIGLACLGVFWLSLTPGHEVIVNARHLIALVLLVDIARFAQVDGEKLVAHFTKEIHLAWRGKW